MKEHQEPLEPEHARKHRRGMAYSQLSQDLWILGNDTSEYDKFFVEIGAYNGKFISNTLLLEENGWNGLCVEPNPELYSELIVNRRCRTSNLAVHDGSSDCVFQLDDWNSGIVDHLDKQNSPTGKITVNTISLHDLLTLYKCPKDIAYISIDTEGNELQILQNFPFHEWNVGFWTVEHNDHVRKNRSRSRALTEIFNKNGYECIKVKFDLWASSNRQESW
tara:strand:- start:1414 stop:2073 length:660 start_codon:yes stop_codon:yes gene_type:complete